MSTTLIAPSFPSVLPKTVSTDRIVSISPFRLYKQMCLGTCFYTFDIPPQPRGKYHIMEVSDSYTLIRTDFENLSGANPDAPLGPARVDAPVLAMSLVAEWSRKLATQGETGVRVMPRGMEEGSAEFKAFIADMTEGVKTLAQWAIRAAGDMYGTNQSRFISDSFHRCLALWMYGESGVGAVKWFNAQAIDSPKKCLKCNNSIDAAARGCTHCGVDLIDYFIKYSFTEADDPFIAAIVARMKTPAAAEGTSSTAGVPLEFRVTIPGTELPADARLACVNAMDGEQKAAMHAKKGQEGRDAYISSIIPELCLKNAGLRDILIGKGYVTSNAD